MVHILLKSNAYDKITNQPVKIKSKKPGRASKQTPGSCELIDYRVNFNQKHSKL